MDNSGFSVGAVIGIISMVLMFSGCAAACVGSSGSSSHKSSSSSSSSRSSSGGTTVTSHSDGSATISDGQGNSVWIPALDDPIRGSSSW